MKIAVYTILNALELITTWLVGIEYEMNPMMKEVWDRFGFVGFIGSKVLQVGWFGLCITLMDRMRWPHTRRYCAVMNGIVLGVVIWNTVIFLAGSLI